MAITWAKFSGAGRSCQGTTTALTESAPSASTDGIDLTGCDSLRVSVGAPNGQTFDGTGAFLAYVYSAHLAAWIRAPEYDVELSDANGLSRVAFSPLAVTHKAGRFALVPSSVGVSGGTALTINLEASYGAGALAL
jgi:hypothetical protein